MNNVIKDLFADMRSRRLLPVAIALVVALIAVPIVLSRSSEKDGEPIAPAGAAASAQDLAPAVSTKAPSLHESDRLKAFSQKNPFRAPKRPSRASKSASGVVQKVGAASSGASISAPSAPSSSDSSSGASSAGSTSSTSGNAEGRTVHVPRPYSHTVDLRVGRVFHTHIRRGVGRLSLLPSQSSPVISFLGATEGETGAVFMVADGALPKGRGTCRPSRANCRFLVLKRGEAEFLDFRPRGGNLYEIKLLDIERHYLKRSKKSDKLAAFLRLSS
jgi:hypothetical protein